MMVSEMYVNLDISNVPSLIVCLIGNMWVRNKG